MPQKQGLQMSIRRSFIFVLLQVMILLLSPGYVFAADDQQQNVTVMENGDCKMDDQYREVIAKEGKNASGKANARLTQLGDALNKIYKDESGPCHYLSGTSGKWWREAGTSKLSYESDAVNGAKLADEKKWTAGAANNLESFNSSGYNDYTEWDIPKLYQRVSSGSYTNDKVYEQLKAIEKSGAGCAGMKDINIEDGSDAYRAIKEISGGFNCEGIRCVGGKFTCIDWNVAGKDTVGPSFSSADDFRNKVLGKNSNSQKCANALQGLINVRSEMLKLFNDARRSFMILGSDEVECTCQKDENGKLTNKVDTCKAVGYEDEENIEKDCKLLSEYQAEMGEICLTCGLMAKILGAVQKISQSAFEEIAPSLVKLLLIAFLIYMAYTTLLMLGSPETQKISRYLTSLLVQGAKVAIAILILNSPKALYGYAINPILEGGIDFGLAFSNITGGDDKTGESFSVSEDNNISQKVKENGAEYSKNFDGNNEYLSASLLEKMVGANKNFSKEAASVPALGRALICNSWLKKVLVVFPSPTLFINGAVLLVFGVMIWLAIGFYILDCCLELGVVVAMMSFFVACWPFKLTSAYVKVGWDMLINVFFNFIMISVVLVTITMLSRNVMPDGIEDMLNAGEDRLDELADELQIIGLKMALIIVTCMICVKLGRESGRLANKFAGGAAIKMGANLGGLAGSVATNTVKGTVQTAGKAAGGLAGSAAEASGASAAISAGKNAVVRKLGGGNKSGGASFNPGSAGRGAAAAGGEKPSAGSGRTPADGGQKSNGTAAD